MKKTVTAIILVCCSFLLLSCGNVRQETLSPTAAHDNIMIENDTTSVSKMDVDDSITFYSKYEYSEDGISPHVAMREAFVKAYSERMGQYIENFELSELHFIPLRDDASMFVGYFIFTGTPIDSLGWKQAESYCRSFNLSSDDFENWSFAKSYPMKQGECLAYTIYSDDYLCCKYAEPVITGLSSAELYVSQLGESYTLTDMAGLDELAQSLSQKWGWDSKFSGTSLDMDCEFVNPLYLSFTDGSTKIVLTAGDGSNACYIWDLWYPYNTGKSIFEQFGVPLAAVGYERSGDMTTTTNSFVYDSFDTDDEGKYKGSDTRVYDSAGRPVEIHKYWDSAMPVGGAVHDLVTLEYNSDGKLIKSDSYSDGVLYTTSIYEYDGQGLLIRRTTVFSGAVNGVECGAGVIEEYKYDELGRVIEIKSYYPNDEGGPSTSYASFWYDDDGYRSTYAYNDSGNIIGREDEPIRREE